MYPARMTVQELAECWNLTDQRIRQFIRGGKLTKGSDGKVDREEAFAFRAGQLDENQARALFQTYGNASGSIDRKIAAHIAAEEYVDADDFLADDPTPAQAPATHKEVLANAVNKQSRLTELKTTEMEFKLQREMRREQLAEGKLIERKDVYKMALHAGAEITGMLNSLEHEIAAKFENYDTRAEVRTIIGVAVDRCRFAFAKRFEALAKGEADEDDI